MLQQNLENNHFTSVIRTTMNQWEKLARKKKESLLQFDKNYARRINTIFRKAFEATVASINGKHGNVRCRIAVLQEIGNHRSAYLSHEDDETWPPSRDNLLRVWIWMCNSYFELRLI